MNQLLFWVVREKQSLYLVISGVNFKLKRRHLNRFILAQSKWFQHSRDLHLHKHAFFFIYFIFDSVGIRYYSPALPGTLTHIRWLLQFFGRDTGEHHNGIDALLRTEDRLNKSKQICFGLIASDRQALALHLKTQVAPPLVRFCPYTASWQVTADGFQAMLAVPRQDHIASFPTAALL